MNTEKKRIPFDWEKYQSGEYEAVCRDGSIPEQITYYQTAKNDYKIVSIINGCIEAFTQDGFWSEPNDENEYDLFLIPKPKKYQAWVNLYSNGAAQSFVSKEVADEFNRFHIVNGVIRVECRLIEWEG
jgi:hypothetical protein